jgi:hypothetical protein
MAHAHPQPEIHNPDTKHETSDVNIRAIVWFVVVLAAVALAIQAAMVGMFVILDKIEVKNEAPVSPLALPAGTAPPEPHLQTTPWADLKTLRAEESAYLHGYGWVDQGAGVARVPIDKAKAMLLQKGIPVRPELGDPTEGTHVAAMGESNSARTIPAGQGDASSAGSTAPAAVPPATPAPGAAAPGNEPPKKPGGGV